MKVVVKTTKKNEKEIKGMRVPSETFPTVLHCKEHQLLFVLFTKTLRTADREKSKSGREYKENVIDKGEIKGTQVSR